jgi:hypothetical protein
VVGFKYVASGPLVRSSYRAGEFFVEAMIHGERGAAAAAGGGARARPAPVAPAPARPAVAVGGVAVPVPEFW